MDAPSTATVSPARRLAGRVLATFAADATDDASGFVTRATDALMLTFEGIPGDRHHGFTRRSGGREPWYSRGTEMRNERQLSLLAPDELRQVAARLGVPEVKPEWLGGNLLIDGLPNLSLLPPSTRLTFEGGAVVVIDAQNRPCRAAGRSIAGHHADRPELELAFVRVAKRLRGLVGWVERPGTILRGAAVSARIPEQLLYPSAGRREF